MSILLGASTRWRSASPGTIESSEMPLPRWRETCVALAGAQRVYVQATDLATYPDVSVACGRPNYDADGRTLLNPSLLVEVLSPSTEDHDLSTDARNQRSSR